MQTVSEELCACRKELEAQTAAQKRAAQDREELAKAGAALDVRLNSADRKACGLTQELAALRFVCVYMCGLTSKRVGVRLVWWRVEGVNLPTSTKRNPTIVCSTQAH